MKTGDIVNVLYERGIYPAEITAVISEEEGAEIYEVSIRRGAGRGVEGHKISLDYILA